MPRHTKADMPYKYLIPYTNPRAINWDEEARNYTDEWSIFDITDPRWSDAVRANTKLLREKADTFTKDTGSSYEVEPCTESYIDMLLYYHQKMLTTFADGIYWDNFFLLPQFQPGVRPRLCR